MPEAVFLRAAVPDDAATIARVFRSSFRTVLPAMPDLHTPAEDLQYFATQVLTANEVLVAVDAGSAEVLGFIAFAADWVNHLYLRPDIRRRGIGSRLLRRAQDRSSHLCLWTFQVNAAARAFYAYHGFVEVRLTDGERNEEREPDVLLEWRRR
ncbi:MAG: N-acetyltransferase family protein [Dehalococcoidia bacterium]